MNSQKSQEARWPVTRLQTLGALAVAAISLSGTGVHAQHSSTGLVTRVQASSGEAGQRAGFDIFLMGVVTKTNYEATPPTVTMKVIEGALERLGQEVEVIIETEEAIKHFKKRVKVGVELDTRVRVGSDGKLYMATSQRRGIPSREFKGGPTIEDSVKKLLESGG